MLDNANQIKTQWGSNLIEIPHLLIALGRDSRIGNYVFQEGDLSVEQLEEELKFFPNINQSKNYLENKKNIFDKDNKLLNKSIGKNVNKGNSVQQSKALIFTKK